MAKLLSAPTLADVAGRAGVTRLTAQRALHGQPGVGEKARKKIQAIAGKLGYRPHWAARAMRSGRMGCLTLLISVERYRGFVEHELLSGIVAEASDRDYHITIGALPTEKATDPQSLPKALQEFMADGLLINYHFGIPPKMAELIEQHRIPAVWINTRRAADCVHIDDIQAGRLATERLLQLGHRRVAYIDYDHSQDRPETAHYSVIDRAAGYQIAMKAAGLPAHVIALPPDLPGGEQLEFTRRWLSGTNRPTGIVMYSAAIAPTIAMAAAPLGIYVPQQMSMVAVDWPVPKFLGAEMTVALPQVSEMGRAAVRMLLEKIADPRKRMRALAIPAAFHEGKTCGSPA
ncbi:MAG TPA: LacI family DNA-binding transcriptional regulator [Planctomycetota bacterium]